MTEAGVFDSEYARFYDLMYHDKPYAEEAAWAASMLRRLNPKAVSLLELGCGTLNHAPHLAEAGFEIACVDSSSAMMEQAKVRLSSLPPRLAERIGLHREDILTLDLGLTFDAACSLFHVFDYFTENDSLASAFSAVSRHLVQPGAYSFSISGSAPPCCGICRKCASNASRTRKWRFSALPSPVTMSSKTRYE